MATTMELIQDGSSKYGAYLCELGDMICLTLIILGIGGGLGILSRVSLRMHQDITHMYPRILMKRLHMDWDKITRGSKCPPYISKLFFP